MPEQPSQPSTPLQAKSSDTTARPRLVVRSWADLEVVRKQVPAAYRSLWWFCPVCGTRTCVARTYDESDRGPAAPPACHPEAEWKKEE